MNLFTKVKQSVQRMLWPYGTIATIARGHLKGFKFVISENSGWSPILGRWEPESHEIFSRIVKPGQTVFDLGANNGIHSLFFAKLVGPAGRVYAFEPLPENITELKRNCELNGIKNIEIVPAAVSDQDGETKFLLGKLNKQGSLVGIGSQTGKEVVVKLTSLKTFIETTGAKPDFIKVDIEGAESSALRGFEDLIREIKPVFFIELHTPEQDKLVGEVLKRVNYSAYRLINHSVPNDLDIPNIEPIKTFDLIYPHPDGIWGTILAVPAKA